MDLKGIKELYVHAFKGTSPDVSKFSTADVKATLKEELANLAPNRIAFEENRFRIYQIIQESYDEVLPEFVGNTIGQLAEIKFVKKNERALFTVKRGRRRAKTFVTEAGISGVYESFRLDSDTFTVAAKCYGGAARIDWERYTTGDEDITEPMNLLLEGLEEAIYKELIKALITAVMDSDMPVANKVTSNGFNPTEMARLVTIAKNYGKGSAVIFATPEFVREMGPDAIGLPIGGNPSASLGSNYGGYATPVYSPKDLADIAATGSIQVFRGTPIVQLDQGFVDENNDTLQIPPSFAYIFPAGQQKIIKVVFEGETEVDDFKGRDRSMELEIYKRFGIAILTTNNWCAYRNTALETAQYACVDYLSNKVNPHNFQTNITRPVH